MKGKTPEDYLACAKSYMPPSKEMKAVDLISDYMEYLDVDVVFVVTGGAALHLIHSFSRSGNFTVLPMQHEQSGAMAADAYARITNKFGVSIATSGPGATNLLTGVCCSYYDGIPSIFFTGQVDSDKLALGSGTRQIGFQETNVVDIFKPVTKYSVLLKDAKRILFELEKAITLSLSGRPGPVHIDICSDVQRTIIMPSELDRYFQDKELNNDLPIKGFQLESVRESLRLLYASKKPVFIIGAGIRQSGQYREIMRLIEKLQIPYTTTWGAADVYSQDSNLFIGTFGTYPGEIGNKLINEADLLFIIGSRLDKKTLGNDSSKFAPNAKKIMVDIELGEINKFVSQNMQLDLGIYATIKWFLEKFAELVDLEQINLDSSWIQNINNHKMNYPILQKSDIEQPNYVNPYLFMSLLSDSVKPNTIVVTDCGSNLVWTMQGMKINNNITRVISAWNHSPMGYSLPAAIGAYFGDTRSEIICITGDGGLQMNIQELATIQRHKLPIKIFVMNNHGHGIIQQGQDQYFGGEHVATNFEGGLPDPEYKKVAEAYGIPAIKIANNKELASQLSNFLNLPGPQFCELDLRQGQQIHN